MRCNTKQFIYYSASSLYMFQVSTTRIIRSTKTVTTASGTGHIFCAATSPNMAKIALTLQVAAQKI